MRRLAMFVCAASCAAAGTPPGNLLVNPGFEDGASGWTRYGKPRYRVLDGCGRRGKGLRYSKPAEDAAAKENSHFDQVAAVRPRALYVASLWVKAEAGLRPVLRIADMNWKTLAIAAPRPGAGWRPVRVAFWSGDSKSVRFQIFGGSRTLARESAPGTSFFDDASLRAASDADAREPERCEIRVRPDQTLHPVNPLFFGVNSLFWVEDDAARRDGKIAHYLKAMPCTLLRFPAGEAADNYHWRTHKLDNPKRWPYREDEGNMDTDEFMAWIRLIGAEPIFVVNLESSFKAGDVARGAAEAAAWVRYCKTKGYRVRFWEIGNETYLKGTYCPLTARQYAQAFAVFAKAMKAEDPAIRLGAIGPFDPKAVAAIERGKGPAWWPTVVDGAGKWMDFAVVHRYEFYNGYAGFQWKASPVARLTQAMRRFLDQRFPRRRIPLALTEWNTWRKARARGMGQALMVAELIGRYLEGGMDMACFWPLRVTGKKSSFRGLLDRETNEPMPPYYVMQAVASELTRRASAPGARAARVVSVETSHPLAYCFAARGADDSELVAFIVNKSLWPGGVRAEVSLGWPPPYSRVQAAALTAPSITSNRVTPKPLPVKRSGRTLALTLPPHSFTRVTIQPARTAR